MAGALRAQLEPVAVRVAKVDRFDEAVIRDAARLDALNLDLGHHLRDQRGVHLERDVQVAAVLLIEVERHVGHLKKASNDPVAQPARGVQCLGGPAALGFLDIERAGQRQSEEFLVEAPRQPRAVHKVLPLQSAMPRQTDFNQPLFADMQGFSLHAAVHCAAARKQRFVAAAHSRYLTRLAQANECVQCNAAGQVLLKLKTPCATTPRI